LPDAVTQFREYIRLDRKHRGGGLTPAELERWTRLKSALAKKLSPELGDEHSDRRASLRVPVQLRVDFLSIGEMRDQLMTNISRGGLFVATAHLLEIGTRVTLHINIESSGEVLEIPAEVVSQNLGPGYQSEAPGMGFRFLEMDDSVKRKLDDLYDESLQRLAGSGAAE
jgi:uncharacterized protein (TIGR02266 family)